VIAVWIPVTVVPTSSATCLIDTFITELSSVMRNWPEARVRRTIPAAALALLAILVKYRVFPFARPGWGPKGMSTQP
jgi:hypothetical protein